MMTISEALLIVDLEWCFRVRQRSAAVYVRGRWNVTVRRRKHETVEQMIVRLAEKIRAAQAATHPPPRRKPSRRSKAALKRVPTETLRVN